MFWFCFTAYFCRLVLSQGVCWLNTSLTFTSTEQTELKRHLAWWKPVVEKIIDVILEAKSQESSKEKKALVFVLWGGHAQKLSKSVEKLNKYGLDIRFIDANHPAANGDAFHAVLSFESVNKHLSELGASPINWMPTRGAGTGSATNGKRSASASEPKAAPAAAALATPSPAKPKAAPKRTATSKRAAAAKAKAASSASESDAEEVAPRIATSGRPQRGAVRKVYKEADSDDDADSASDSEDKKARKPAAKRAKRE